MQLFNNFATALKITDLKKNYVKYEVALIYCGVEQLISKATN
jgi:hypothetical protein